MIKNKKLLDTLYVDTPILITGNDNNLDTLFFDTVLVYMKYCRKQLLDKYEKRFNMHIIGYSAIHGLDLEDVHVNLRRVAQYLDFREHLDNHVEVPENIYMLN